MRLVRPGKGQAGRSGSWGGRARIVVGGVIVASAALLSWAWVDGGREPLREIVQPIPVPEQPR